MAIVVGIDLGTTNSAAAVFKKQASKNEDQKPEIIENLDGGRTTPSVVAHKDNSFIIGNAAKRQAVINPNTFSSVKRKMGTKETLDLNGKKLKPEEVSAKVLAYLKKCCEKKLGQPITNAVITVPAYFNDAQRQATKNAGTIAGLKVERIINEPTAAALAYGIDKLDHDQKIMVFDIGGGTFDVSVLHMSQGTFEVLATSGNNHLGGDDFDNRIVDWMVNEFGQKEGVNLRDNNMAMQRLKEAAETAKIELSNQKETLIELPFIAGRGNQALNLSMKLSRAHFNKITEDLVAETVPPIKDALQEAKITPQELNQVLMVGGSTRIPAIQETVKSILKQEPNLSINPDEVVALGAAIQGGVLSGDVKDVLLLDVTPLTLGIETLGGVATPLIKRNTTIPTTKSQVFSTAADDQTEVDIHVLQGERSLAAENKTLGRFQLTGIDKAPRGVPQIEVSFSINVNGIVSVTAKDKKTNQEQSITIKNNDGLSKEEIEKMIKEAEQHKAEDQKRLHEIEIKNQAENFINTLEKTLTTGGEKMPAQQKKQTEDQITKVRTLLAKQDYEGLEKILKEFNNSMQQAAEWMKKNPEAFKKAQEEMAKGNVSASSEPITPKSGSKPNKKDDKQKDKK